MEEEDDGRHGRYIQMLNDRAFQTFEELNQVHNGIQNMVRQGYERNIFPVVRNSLRDRSFRRAYQNTAVDVMNLSHRYNELPKYPQYTDQRTQLRQNITRLADALENAIQYYDTITARPRYDSPTQLRTASQEPTISPRKNM